LTRIDHQVSAAVADPVIPTALRFIGLLGASRRMIENVGEALSRTNCFRIGLRRLAGNPVKKAGKSVLDLGVLQFSPEDEHNLLRMLAGFSLH